MELRHLRCFLAIAEKLHIEQSRLSRTLKELEEELGEQLFVRTSRSTRLTRAGQLFLAHVPRIFTALQQARDSVHAAANGLHGQWRIARFDGITLSRPRACCPCWRCVSRKNPRSRFACSRCRCRSRSSGCRRPVRREFCPVR